MKKSLGLIAVLAAALLSVPSVYAQQASAPAGSTGQCKDASYTSQASKRGACRGHQGVKDWYAAAPAAGAAAAMPAAAPAPATAPAPAAAPAAAPTAAAAPASKSKTAMPTTAAAGGGPGLVWANDKSKVYHCQNDKWYGKTKQGEYMSEADAKAKGFHGVKGQTCTP